MPPLLAKVTLRLGLQELVELEDEDVLLELEVTEEDELEEEEEDDKDDENEEDDEDDEEYEDEDDESLEELLL